ncbi:hypothetical protein MRB53_040447 [Persea americana]|nr:hypothetical protein MRB53_040447 [Persea americana]
MSSLLAIASLLLPGQHKASKDYWITLFAVVLPIVSITPFSISYTFYAFFTCIRTWQFPTWLHGILLVYAAAELATFVYLWTTWLRKRKPVKGPQLPDETLTSILSKIITINAGVEDFATAEEEAAAFRQSFTGWFFRCSFEAIKRDNVMSWLAWSAYNAQPAQLTESQHSVCKTLLHKFEDRCQRIFPPGSDRYIRSLRLTLDPSPFVPRPLLFYILVYIINAYVRLELHEMNYTKTTLQLEKYSFEFYHKPSTTESPGEDNSPILFIHGLGMGIAQYRAFLRQLNWAFPRREILLMAQGQTSMMPTHKNYCNPPTTAATMAALTKIAEKYDIQRKGGWTVLSHSFGTISHAWIIKLLDSSFTKRDIMIDPVCFRLWESDVCYNFLYRKPTNAVQLMMSYFVGQELGVAYSLHRAFWWFENLLMPEDIRIKAQPFVAYTAGEDEIIHGLGVARFLQSERIAVRHYPELGHGKILSIEAVGGKALHDVLHTLRYESH